MLPMLAALATVVALLGIILFSVHKARPTPLAAFQRVAHRWLSLTLEVDSPQRPTPGGTTKPGQPSGE